MIKDHMDKVAQLMASANADIVAGTVYIGPQGKIVVLEVSALGDIIWYDDGVMHMVTPSATRTEFCSLIEGMKKS